ncbi:hypothetical protein NDU88_001559 [Pleurodeles waltl]|uniref:Uncharacterized protein n=1 Tax=Pleurodeles waltl TaxID=8319 RepID=A0AAV7VWS1_PLEWA|nr:hypothetical protein NDU88_001559 [Pleurodeles waltl]
MEGAIMSRSPECASREARSTSALLSTRLLTVATSHKKDSRRRAGVWESWLPPICGNSFNAAAPIPPPRVSRRRGTKLSRSWRFMGRDCTLTSPSSSRPQAMPLGGRRRGRRGLGGLRSSQPLLSPLMARSGDGGQTGLWIGSKLPKSRDISADPVTRG